MPLGLLEFQCGNIVILDNVWRPQTRASRRPGVPPRVWALSDIILIYLNLIEMAFAKLKSMLRMKVAGTFDVLSRLGTSSNYCQDWLTPFDGGSKGHGGDAALEPHLPKNQPGAGRADDRRVISGILHILKTGGRWRDVPPE